MTKKEMKEIFIQRLEGEKRDFDFVYKNKVININTDPEEREQYKEICRIKRESISKIIQIMYVDFNLISHEDVQYYLNQYYCY